MHVTLESLSGLERKLSVSIPAEEVTSKLQAKLQQIALKAKMPGFRPGKVPFAVIEKNYKDVARSQVLEDLLRDTYIAAIEQEKLNPASMPDIKIITSQPGEQFAYAATFEVYPEVKLADLQGVEVEKMVSKVADSDVSEMLEKMRKNSVEWQEIIDPARKSQAGDQLTIDFTLTPNMVAQETTEEVKTISEKNIKLVLGDGVMWNEFEQPLYGISAGEEKKYNLQLPATHVNKELAGKMADFVVIVHKICQPIFPALDDKFAEKMSIKEGGLEKLKSEVRFHLERELEMVVQGLFKQAVMDKILDCNSLDVPKALVTKELDRLEHGWRQHVAKSHGADGAETFPRDNYESQAKRSVSLGILLSTVAKENQLQVLPQEIYKKIGDLISAYYEGQDKDKMINKYFNDSQRVAEIKAHLLEEKVVAQVMSKINVKEKEMSYQDIMAKKKSAI